MKQTNLLYVLFIDAINFAFFLVIFTYDSFNFNVVVIFTKYFKEDLICLAASVNCKIQSCENGIWLGC